MAPQRCGALNPQFPYPRAPRSKIPAPCWSRRWLIRLVRARPCTNVRGAAVISNLPLRGPRSLTPFRGRSSSGCPPSSVEFCDDARPHALSCRCSLGPAQECRTTAAPSPRCSSRPGLRWSSLAPPLPLRIVRASARHATLALSRVPSVPSREPDQVAPASCEGQVASDQRRVLVAPECCAGEPSGSASAVDPHRQLMRCRVRQPGLHPP